VNQISALDHIDFVKNVACPRYLLFMGLQNTYPDQLLLPPIDVEAVWFSHMLQSDCYQVFIENRFPNLKYLSHTSILSYTDEERNNLTNETKRLWYKMYYGLYDFNPEENRVSVDLEPLEDQKIQDLIDDRMWFREFIKACQSAGTDDPLSILLDQSDNEDQTRFFENALLGYQRFIYLVTKYPRYVEKIKFSPIPSIDLIWHTHLLQPRSYYKDSMKLTNEIRQHKLLNSHYRTIRFFNDRKNREEIIWNQEFGEMMSRYLIIQEKNEH